MPDATHAFYEARNAVSRYARDTALQPAESTLFSRYVRPGQRILDVGVGAGRTVPALAKGAAEYVGIDYSAAMIDACRARHPGVRLEVQDATDLGVFASGYFDVVVFSFNGLGSLPDDRSRQAALRELVRVLHAAGIFIFSLHNPRYLLYRPQIQGATGLRAIWRVVYALQFTVHHALFRLPSAAFWRGRGYVTDPALGHTRVYTAEPAAVRAELQSLGLELEETLPSTHPRRAPVLTVPWYYYAGRKR